MKIIQEEYSIITIKTGDEDNNPHGSKVTIHYSELYISVYGVLYNGDGRKERFSYILKRS